MPSHSGCGSIKSALAVRRRAFSSAVSRGLQENHGIYKACFLLLKKGYLMQKSHEE